MRRFAIFASVFVLIVAWGVHTPSRYHRHGIAFAASQWNTSECPDNEHESRDHVCELRKATLSAGGRLKVLTANGGIEVIGEDRSDIAVEARVTAWAGSEADARAILREVNIEASSDSIHDSGPKFNWGRRGYGVGYRLHVPRHLAVDLNSTNGGISIAHLDSNISFDTTNGGVELADLAGDVHGQTVNGGLSIKLTGDRWHGKGLSAETTNGGVELGVPENYSAHLETGTVNGGFNFEFPIKVQGEIKKHLSVDLGDGGPTIHAETTNGGISVSHT